MRFLITVLLSLFAVPVLAQEVPAQTGVEEIPDSVLVQYPGQGSTCEIAGPAFFQFQRLHFAVKAVEAQLAVLDLSADASPKDVKKAQDKLKRAEKDYLWARNVELHHYQWLVGNKERQLASAEVRLQALSSVLEFQGITVLLAKKELERKLAVLRILVPRLKKVAVGTADIPWTQLSKEELTALRNKLKQEKGLLRGLLIQVYADFFWEEEWSLTSHFYYECAPYSRRQDLDRVGL
jgi:hypothetical protein